MNTARLIRNNLIHYRGKNLLLVLGIALSGAVITGALMVGDSVRYSLDVIVEQRLGSITHVFRSDDRYFSGRLQRTVGEGLEVPAAGLLMQEGNASVGGGRIRMNQVNILGVDAHFDTFASTNDYYGSLAGDTIILSENLARRLNTGPGEEVLLRIGKASLIPLNAPFVSDAENLVTLRATVGAVAGREELGRFNMKVSQTAPFNVFISLERLQKLMDLDDRINAMLISSERGEEELLRRIREEFSAADAGLRISGAEGAGSWVESERVFLEDTLSASLKALHGEGPERADGGEPIISYFVNAIAHQADTTPYSFVSTLPGHWLRKDEILINTWLAEDLGAAAGEKITMSWFEVGPLRELREVTGQFVVRGVVPMEDRFALPGLMPDLPGLSDAGNCRDWETGVPIRLDRIRDKDEDYWDEHGGTPKAFISIDRGEEIWANRFGTYTAYHLPGFPPDSLREVLFGTFDPINLGFRLESLRSEGKTAAREGVDFSQLFAGLSFFLLAAGILLSVLLFLLNLESREDQIWTLSALGIPRRRIRRIFLVENVILSLLGAMAGIVLAMLYNHLVFIALNGVWRDVVRTEVMETTITLRAVLAGGLLTFAAGMAATWFPLNRRIRALGRRHLQKAGGQGTGSGPRIRRLPGPVALVSGVMALGLILSSLAIPNAGIGIFFPAGTLLLVSLVSAFLWLLQRQHRERDSGFSMRDLGWKNATRNPTRSMSIMILFALGAFLVVSTGSNRKDLFKGAGEASSGTGGFLYFAESTLPVLRQLDDPRVRSDYGLEGQYSFVQLRQADGDDASCLNLNRVISPRILGVDPGKLKGRFHFETSTPYLDPEDPWKSLSQELSGGLIPAIADETVIKWGLGLSVGDTLHYTNSSGKELDLLLIGGLAPSIFQGNVLIDQDRFLEQFPENSGTHVFLVDGALSDTALIEEELGRSMRDMGWDMQLGAARLAEFNSVTNSYLSIFMVMGALGLLLGIFGMVVVLSRSLLERKKEIALLFAVGYGKEKIRRLVAREYMILLVAGILTGFLSAVLATLPAMLSSYTGASLQNVLLWLGILLLNGWIWIALVSRRGIRTMHIQNSLRDE